jgi:hypothetical protein
MTIFRARMPTGTIAPSLLVAGVASLVAACGTSFVPLRVTDAVSGAGVVLRGDVTRVWLTEDVASDGFGDDAALAVELDLHNASAETVTLTPMSFVCVMEVDAAHPSETLSLLPGGGGEGPFPGELPGERSVQAPLEIPAGRSLSIWVLFRGYRYPDSEVPRRVVVKIPGGEGQPALELTLADPARGKLRWALEAPRSGWAVGFVNTSLFSDHLDASVVGTQLSRLVRARRLLWEVGLTSSVLVQKQGALVSSTSSFAGSGLAARVAVPVVLWGTAREPRQLGFYGGGQALVLLETQVPQPAGDPALPNLYGTLSAEAGLELEVGSVHFAATPFPLSQLGRALPRWSTRVGYTHWWVAGGGSHGYITSLRLAW